MWWPFRSRTADQSAVADDGVRDPIGDLCRLLVEKAWEWRTLGDSGAVLVPSGYLSDADLAEIAESTPRGRIISLPRGMANEWAAAEQNLLIHRSGTAVRWDQDRFPARVWVSINGVEVRLGDANANTVLAAVVASAVARAKKPQGSFTESANLLAREVLAGNEQAAWQLADEVFEFAKGGGGESGKDGG